MGNCRGIWGCLFSKVNTINQSNSTSKKAVNTNPNNLFNKNVGLVLVLFDRCYSFRGEHITEILPRQKKIYFIITNMKDESLPDWQSSDRLVSDQLLSLSNTSLTQDQLCILTIQN